MQALATWLQDSWWVLVAIGLGGAGVWLTYRGLMADRAKGRRRCPKCWYELQAAAVPVRCSECGHVTTHDRQLLRTHRRWSVALAGVVLLMLAPWTRRIPDAVQHGPARLVPTLALLQLCGDEQVKQWTEETLLYGPKATSPFAQELVRRGVEEAIPAWQSEMFERRVRRYLVNKGEAVMPSGEEEILRRLDAAKLPSDRTIAEMEELFAEVGKALGTRVEVDWESMWEGRVLKTDRVGVDTRGLTCSEVLSRAVESRPGFDGHLAWEGGGDANRCARRKDAKRGLFSFDVSDLVCTALDQVPVASSHCGMSPPLYHTREYRHERASAVVTRLLCGMVTPEVWSENGGLDGNLACLGDRALARAPKQSCVEMERLLETIRHPATSESEAWQRLGFADPSGPPRDAIPRRVAYDLSDFVEWQRQLEYHAPWYEAYRTADEVGQQLASVVWNVVTPELWAENGGDIGSARAFGTVLIVTHTAQGHAEVMQLFDKIRSTRPKLKKRV